MRGLTVWGHLTVTVSCSDGALRIAVADEGPGLPKDLAALLNRAASEPAPRRARLSDFGEWPPDPSPGLPCGSRASGCRYASGRRPSSRIEGGTHVAA